MAAKALARVSVRQMHFDEGQAHRKQCVAQGETRMRKRPRIENQESNARLGRGVQALDEFVLGVTLKRGQLMARLARKRGKTLLNRGERVLSIDLGLATAEQVQVRTVKQQNARHRRRMYPNPWRMREFLYRTARIRRASRVPRPGPAGAMRSVPGRPRGSGYRGRCLAADRG